MWWPQKCPAEISFKRTYCGEASWLTRPAAIPWMLRSVSLRLLSASHWAWLGYWSPSIPAWCGIRLTGNIFLGTLYQSGWGFLRNALQSEDVSPITWSKVSLCQLLPLYSWQAFLPISLFCVPSNLVSVSWKTWIDTLWSYARRKIKHHFCDISAKNT